MYPDDDLHPDDEKRRDYLVRMLTLAGEPFKELVLHSPEISFEIFKVLSARIRAAEVR